MIEIETLITNLGISGFISYLCFDFMKKISLMQLNKINDIHENTKEILR